MNHSFSMVQYLLTHTPVQVHGRGLGTFSWIHINVDYIFDIRIT